MQSPQMMKRTRKGKDMMERKRRWLWGVREVRERKMCERELTQSPQMMNRTHKGKEKMERKRR
jgi:hypothetical protein